MEVLRLQCAADPADSLTVDIHQRAFVISVIEGDSDWSVYIDKDRAIELVEALLAHLENGDV